MLLQSPGCAAAGSSASPRATLPRGLPSEPASLVLTAWWLLPGVGGTATAQSKAFRPQSVGRVTGESECRYPSGRASRAGAPGTLVFVCSRCWPLAILSGQLCSGKCPQKGRTLKSPKFMGQCRLMFCLHKWYLNFLLKGSFPSELKSTLSSTHKPLCVLLVLGSFPGQM